MDGILLPDSAYSWKDEWLELNTRYLTSGKHTIRLHVSDRAGNQTTLEKTVLVQNNQPQALSLGQNFPNPFNPSTTIPLFIAAPNATPVHLDIYNTAGQRVRRLLNQALAPGAHRIVWDARDDSGRPLASGTYLYRLEVNGNLLARKLNLMR